MFEYVVLFILFIGSCYWIIHPLLEQAVRQNGFRPKQEGILKELRHKKKKEWRLCRHPRAGI
jgi:hypothetical protein